MPTGPVVARAVVPTTDLDGDVALFGDLGFRLDAIWPADDPAHALLSTAALTIELRRQDGPAAAGEVVVVVAVDVLPATGDRLDAPGGARIELVADEPVALPPRDASGSIVTHMDADTPWIVGRAGMRYRDLVPGRLGGRYIASHIEIPDGGEVPDYVHFHDVVFQLIYCAAGWVRVVYEDQGEPFVLRAGDCVLQPPLIRHRVLEASEGLEVIEIGCPAEHLTRRDHALDLPTAELHAERDFRGQRFVRHHTDDAPNVAWRDQSLRARDTGIGAATDGLARVVVATMREEPADGTDWLTVTDDVTLLYVLAGRADLELANGRRERLRRGSTVALVRDERFRLSAWDPSLELLDVAVSPS
jgi:quercetin dioxygenase-like cupin family protein